MGRDAGTKMLLVDKCDTCRPDGFAPCRSVGSSVTRTFWMLGETRERASANRYRAGGRG